MDLISKIKENLNEKYLDMLNETTKAQSIKVSIESTKEFLSECKEFCKKSKEPLISTPFTPAGSAAPVSVERTYPTSIKVIEYIAFLSPILFSFVYALILFINKTQISITSNYPLWLFFWIVFAIASITAVVIFFKMKDDYNSKKNQGFAALAALAMCISLVVVLPFAFRLQSDFNPPEFLKITLDSKSTSISYSQYQTTLNFTVENQGQVKISYFSGEMEFYSGYNLVSTREVYWNGDFEPNQSYTSILELTFANNTLYNTTFEDLGIKYKITKMEFNSDGIRYDFNGDFITIKESAAWLAN